MHGPPGYGDTPKIDMVENPWILTLEEPINVHLSKSKFEEGNFTASRFNIGRVQLHSNKERITVDVSGEIWEAQTGHHFTPGFNDCAYY